MVTIERPEGFRDHHHRALVLLAGAPTGDLLVADDTTSTTIGRDDIALLRAHHLVLVVNDARGRYARVTALGRDLIAQLHHQTFAVRTDQPEALPSVAPTAVPADSHTGSAGTTPPPGPGSSTPPAPSPGELLAQLRILAVEVMPDEQQRNWWYSNALVSLGYPKPKSPDSVREALGELSTVELLRVVERLAKWVGARDRNARRRGLGGMSPGYQR